jgi:hypothetical protein
MKNMKRSDKSTRASLEKEMAKPRVAKSARIAQLNLDTDRIPGPTSTTMPGTVIQIIPSRHPGKPDSAQIALDGDEKLHQNLRIENLLTDEHGDDVKLKKGAPVEVTVTAWTEKKPD